MTIVYEEIDNNFKQYCMRMCVNESAGLVRCYLRQMCSPLDNLVCHVIALFSFLGTFYVSRSSGQFCLSEL